MVTHQLQFLKEADNIILMKDGSVVLQGDYKNLKSSKYFSMLAQSSYSDDQYIIKNKNFIPYIGEKTQVN